MRRVTDFIGIAFHPALISRGKMISDQLKQESGGRIVENRDKYAEDFDPTTCRDLERIAGRTLARQGYTVELEGDESPSRARMALWAFTDNARMIAHYAGRYRLAYTRTNIKKAMAALHQGSVNRF